MAITVTYKAKYTIQGINGISQEFRHLVVDGIANVGAGAQGSVESFKIDSAEKKFELIGIMFQATSSTDYDVIIGDDSNIDYSDNATRDKWIYEAQSINKSRAFDMSVQQPKLGRVLVKKEDLTNTLYLRINNNDGSNIVTDPLIEIIMKEVIVEQVNEIIPQA